MKKISYLLWLSVFLWVAACVPLVETTPSPDGEVTEAVSVSQTEAAASGTVAPAENGLTVDALKNSSFYSPFFQKTVQLSNGKLALTDETGMYSVEMLPEIAIGDLNDDQVDDAALLLAENGGGTGVFVSLVVVASNGDEYEQVGSFAIDDRPIIQSLAIQDGEILLKAIIHDVDDAMIEPTLKVKETFRLFNQFLTITSLSSTNRGGIERSIRLDLPVDGSEVSNPVQIKGSMPVAPFENNLSLTVYDLNGLVLYQSGFMVTADNPGEPATFDSSVIIENLPANTWVRLELAELSMADGSLININSVLVKIQ
mgnify:CR=1 FL=1